MKKRRVNKTDESAEENQMDAQRQKKGLGAGAGQGSEGGGARGGKLIQVDTGVATGGMEEREEREPHWNVHKV